MPAYFETPFGGVSGGSTCPQLCLHSIKKWPSSINPCSRLFDATEKSMPMPAQPRMSFTPSCSGGPSPPHSTTAGSFRAAPFHGLIQLAPVPPDSETNEASRLLRACASCALNNAPALTPTLETQLALIGYC